VPDDTSHVWVDTTFIPPVDEELDVPVQVHLANSENIGSYSMPVIYSQHELRYAANDVLVAYFNELTSISGLENVAGEYFAFYLPMISGVEVALTEFTAGQKDLEFGVDAPVIYTTGFNSVSGTLNELVVFTGGKEFLAVDNIPAYCRTSVSVSGIMEWWVNHTNFSGNLTNSGIPIPFHLGEYSYQTRYSTGSTATSGFLDNIVDISFAGWVGFPMLADVCSSDEGYTFGYTSEVTAISGAVDVNYTDTVCSLLTTSGIDTDIYCALTDYAHVGGEVETIKGKLGFLYEDVYSTIENEVALKLNIDLLSLKISNFSLNEGEFVTSSGFISVDVTDDECPVSVSGTYFMVDNVRVLVTFSGIKDGYRMYYNPEDDFGSIEGPTTFTVHAENECAAVLEMDYYLTFGYIVEYENNPTVGMDYGFYNKVAVRVTAENYASCPKVGSLAWDFKSVGLKNNDLGASIVGRFYACGDENLSAEIYPHSTAYFYSKKFTVVVKAKDFAGNEMEPFVLSYKIENKPEN